MKPFSPMPNSISIAYAHVGGQDFATRQSVDTQKALVTQYQAAIMHDEAVMDDGKFQLGYTTITSPLAGRSDCG